VVLLLVVVRRIRERVMMMTRELLRKGGVA
jgi:hypothetical protein